MIERHRREGYCAALWHGTAPDGSGDVLLEIVERYNVWADESSLRYHYRPHDLTHGKSLEVKTIGGMDMESMTYFALRQFPQCIWVRLR